MKKNEVKVGQTYVAKVGDRLVQVRIDSVHSRGGWNATDTKTGKRSHIKSAQRLRGAAKPTARAKATVAKDEKAKGAAKPEASEATKSEKEKPAAEAKATVAKDEKAKGAAEPDAKAEAAVATGDKAKGVAKPEASEATEAAVAKDEKAKTAKAATKKAKPKKAGGDKKPKRVSALDAAAQVLAKAGKPMRAKELVTAMAEQGLWKSPAGKTPHATLYAAMLREIAAKGDAARFKKLDRGLFASNA